MREFKLIASGHNLAQIPTVNELLFCKEQIFLFANSCAPCPLQLRALEALETCPKLVLNSGRRNGPCSDISHVRNTWNPA